ncbi:MAG TPA: TonB-dependent receptor [Terriglobia bacterium]|nr:TonB-dependent receptor [Terriglobia bacterium]
MLTAILRPIRAAQSSSILRTFRTVKSARTVPDESCLRASHSVQTILHRSKFVTAVLALALVAAPRLQASSIGGTVVDPQGRPVPEARVTLLSPLRAVRQRTTSADGRYRFDGLDRGVYMILAQITGFSATDTKVQLSAQQDRTVDLHLKLSALEQQVVVSASLGGALAPQVGSSVSVLSQSDMEDRGNQTIYDVLRAVPGVSVNQSGRWGGVTSVFVRGGESDYNLVLMDGIPLNQFGGSFDFAPLTSDGVERVEVTRSPESALYGDNAVSSVVDIITQQGEGPPHFDLLEEVGNFNTYRLALGASGLTHGLGWSVHASRLYSGGIVPNDQYTDQSALVSLTYPSGGRRQLSFHFFGNANNAGDPGPYGSDPDHLFTGIDMVSRDKQNLFGYALSYADQFTSRFRQVTTATVATNNYDFLSPFGDEFTHNLRAVFNTRSEVLISNQDFLVGGFEFNREQVADTYIADASNVPFLLRRNTFAYFAENRWIPAGRWSITAGVRADDIRTGSLPPDPFGERPPIPANSIVQVNPHLSAAWLAHPAALSSKSLGATRLHTSFGTGIRAPSGFELAFTNNPTLKPERSLSFDAGVEQRMLRDRAVFDLTYFYNRFKDQIEVLGGSLTNLSTFTSANLGNARAQGLEASFHMHPSFAWNFEAGYSFVPTSILALDGTSEALAPFQVGQPLLRRPKNFGFYALSWSRNRLTLETAGYLRGHDLDLEPNYGTYACELGLQCLFENKGYARLDGGFSYRVYRSLELYGRLYNLLDKHYEEVLGYPALPLNFVAGLRFTFPAE